MVSMATTWCLHQGVTSYTHATIALMSAWAVKLPSHTGPMTSGLTLHPFKDADRRYYRSACWGRQSSRSTFYKEAHSQVFTTIPCSPNLSVSHIESECFEMIIIHTNILTQTQTDIQTYTHKHTQTLAWKQILRHT